MTIWDSIFFAFWFFLPAGLANMVPIFAAHTPILKRWEFPMDFHLQFRGQRVFGTNKTIRGLIIGIMVAIIVVYLQKVLSWHSTYLQSLPVDYRNINFFLLGLLLGAGALLGDAVESFFKRQMNLPAGQSWLFFDQLDYIVGGIIFSYWYQPLGVLEYCYIIVIYFALHLISTVSGYVLGLKQNAI